MKALSILPDYVTGFRAATAQPSQKPRFNGAQSIAQFQQAVSGWQEMIEEEAEKVNGFITSPGNPVAIQLVNGYFSAGCMEEEEVFYGCFNTLRLIDAADAVKNDPSLKVLILVLNSPGGSVQMVAEAAQALVELKAARPDVTVLSFINGMACSAAAYVSAAADEIHAVYGSYCGSIGTILVIEDTSELYKTAGIKVHAITDGKYKSLGTPGVEVTPDQLALMTQWVASFGSGFKDFMRSNRPGITDDDMQGQMFVASGDMYPPALIDNANWRSFEEFADSLTNRLSVAL